MWWEVLEFEVVRVFAAVCCHSGLSGLEVWFLRLGF